MKMKFFSWTFIFMLFSFGAFADQNIFPSHAIFKGAQNCAVASDSDSQFCVNFKKAVQGCCPIPGLSMQKIYNMMIAVYGSLQNACEKNAAKYGGTAQTCLDQWNCYWNGGKDSVGNSCDGDGVRCDFL